MSDDVNVFIPDQVRRQAARAEELRRELAGEEPEQVVPPVTDEEEGATTVVEPDRQLEPEAPHQPHPDWEQRYRTLQGKYDAEVGAMRGQISSMERLLANIQAPSPTPSQAPAPVGPAPAYNPADVELYGEDLLEAASRAAEAKYGGTIAQLERQVQQLSGRQEEDRVFRELDNDPELTGRWRQLNTDQRFLDWLQSIDEFAGLSRNAMLQHAYQNGDAMRTGRFFKKYMAEHTAPPPTAMSPQTAPSPARSPAGNGYGNGAAGGPRLEDMAAPGRAAGSGAGNGAPSQRLWSRPEIKAFYHARTQGKYKGREAEAEQLEADLLRASDEGRLV